MQIKWEISATSKLIGNPVNSPTGKEAGIIQTSYFFGPGVISWLGCNFIWDLWIHFSGFFSEIKCKNFLYTHSVSFIVSCAMVRISYKKSLSLFKKLLPICFFENQVFICFVNFFQNVNI